MKTNQLVILFLLLGFGCIGRAQDYPFSNPELSIEERVSDLVSRLTLEEKVMQMLNDAPAIERLGIPSYNWWNECLHGIGRTEYKVTVFPQAIGMAASWNAPLIQQVADVIAEEGRAIYNDAVSKGNRSIYHGLTYWTPNINIFRDPRWGRGQETYGEDPVLTGTMGKAFVSGLQGNDPKYLKAAACAKHYAVHSGPENTRHTFNTFVTDYDLWDTYLPAFRDLIADAGVAGVMCAYNAYSGEPCCANNLLMQRILRDNWNFKGYVTSDCGAIDDFYRHHKTHPDEAHAAADAVAHGTDLDCGRDAYKALVEAVRKGLLSEEQIDISLKRLFSVRYRLGMFDPSGLVKYTQIPLSVLESPAHKETAARMTRESIVLLKNEKDLLPLSKNLKKVAVIGPNADNEVSVLGNYNGFPTEISTPYKAIRNKLKKADVIYEKGVDYVIPSENSEEEMASLVKRMKDRDVVIFVGGISPEIEGEEMPVKIEGFTGGDRTSIKLPAIQTRLMQVLHAEGIPVVFVMMTGSAISTEWESEHLPAILNAWYPGQDAGNAIADILFGDCNPSGKLPVTFYKKDEDLPAFNSYEMGKRTYRYFDGEVLYPFGYGLSYTSFSYGSIKINPQTDTRSVVNLEVEVKNTGKKDGEEVVQVYLSHPDYKGPKPLYALKAFKKIHFKAGESQTVKFTLTPKELGITDPQGLLKVMPGTRKIYIGGCSPSRTSTFQPAMTEAEIKITGEAYTIEQ